MLDFFKDFVLSNFGLLVGMVFLLLSLIFTGKKIRFVQWLAETSFFAWNKAEQKGILEGLKGFDKLDYYIKLAEIEYWKKFKKDMPEIVTEKFVDKATELSIKEKVIAASSPK